MDTGDDCWLGYRPVRDAHTLARWTKRCRRVALSGSSEVLENALAEARLGFSRLLSVRSAEVSEDVAAPHVLIAGPGSRHAAAILGAVDAAPDEEVFVLRAEDALRGSRFASMDVDRAGGLRADGAAAPRRLVITGTSDAACLHGVFALLGLLQTHADVPEAGLVAGTPNRLRMIDHWDNLDGTVERGYAGRSIFFDRGDVVADLGRVRDYARMLASIAVNAVAINNVNVGERGAQLLTARLLPRVANLAAVFRAYGIRLFLSVDFASPVLIGPLASADPLDDATRRWWAAKAAQVYQWIPDLGGFLVKADSEQTPGPYAYGRSQADGANMLAAALRPFDGTVIWRAFVYDCHQDWRDRGTDRAKAAFDTFAPLDGAFDANVVVQVKQGPMDFQVREPPSPLLDGLTRTSRLVELQITQEYTGQQKDLCFLVCQWSDVLSARAGRESGKRTVYSAREGGERTVFPGGEGGERAAYSAREGGGVAAYPAREGGGVTLADVVSGRPDGLPCGGAAGVSNVGGDPTWTGHILAQANLYGFGRLAWDPHLSPDEIAREWTKQTFGPSPVVVDTITEMLLASWHIYESYTAPLGIGWMVTPGSHYGPDIDGYEYSRRGTYHRADRDGIGIDRTARTGTGYTRQYAGERAELYESLATCPDELLLFFHHVGYLHRLRSGKTVIQHIYD